MRTQAACIARRRSQHIGDQRSLPSSSPTARLIQRELLQLGLDASTQSPRQALTATADGTFFIESRNESTLETQAPSWRTYLRTKSPAAAFRASARKRSPSETSRPIAMTRSS